MLAVFDICGGVVSTVAGQMGGMAGNVGTLPGEISAAIGNVGFLASIPLWLVTILGSLFITVLSFILIMTVYSRFFKLYMATAIAPIPLASFAGQPSSSIGVSFVKSYAAILVERHHCKEQNDERCCYAEKKQFIVSSGHRLFTTLGVVGILGVFCIVSI